MAGRLSAAVTRYAAWRDRLTQRQQQLLQVLQFLLLFGALSAPLYFLLSTGWEAPGLRRWTAVNTAAALDTVGIGATAEGMRVVTAELVLAVSRDSTGWKSVLAVTALIAASRRPLQATVAGVLVGAALVLAGNLVRLVSMLYAVIVFGVPYELLHTVLWRWGMMVLVLVVWGGWLAVTRGGNR